MAAGPTMVTAPGRCNGPTTVSSLSAVVALAAALGQIALPVEAGLGYGSVNRVGSAGTLSRSLGCRLA